MSLFSKLFGSTKIDSRYTRIVSEVNALENDFKPLSNEALKLETQKLKGELKGGASLDDILPEAFALTREAAKRTLNQRHFDVQLIGGAVLHYGNIAEMRTGEGKTLVATLPTYLNALKGDGVHVVTVNEYLAKRDTVWMGQVYAALGLKVACLIHDGALMYDPDFHVERASKEENPLKEGGLVDKERDTTGSFLVQTEYLRPVSRADAYKADITYGTNHEFGFDYLRDNLAHNKQNQVQRGHPFAVIDEVDSILIDEARTPLIIAAPDTESSQNYKTFAKIVERLTPETDYVVNEKDKAVTITQEGIDKVEKLANVKDLYAPENIRLTHYLQECLRAISLFKKDRDYVIKNGEVIIVDQFTGRMMVGRRYSGGLHQAIEAKEGVLVQQESRTYAQISIQNYFRLYKKLCGMTGTAQTSAEEFHKVYRLEVVTIPTHRDMVRADMPDVMYKTIDAKYNAIIEDIKVRHQKGQPILIGTVSIVKNEELARRLSAAGLKYEALNAKNNEREGAIIAQAGKPHAITVATNMAGRGVDIILGGNPSTKEEQEKVKSAGGLHVVGTERHESRRIDNQLRGRAGRQGDPGSSQFFLSMEDDLMRIFGGDRIKGLMERLKLPEDTPIQARMLTGAIGQSQGKVEGHNFDARKHLLEYDDVLNKQRLTVYRRRQEILETGKVKMIDTPVEGQEAMEANERELQLTPVAASSVLGTLDAFWMEHLEQMEALQESVRLRAVGQRDPLSEYRREGHDIFRALLADFDSWLKENEDKLRLQVQMVDAKSQAPAPVSSLPNILAMGEAPRAVGDASSEMGHSHDKIGRNDPCPCGSGLKYKKCGLINAPEHKR